MSKQIYSLSIIFLIAGFFFLGCQSTTQKAAEANEDVVKAEEQLKEDQKAAQMQDQKLATEEEFKMYKETSEATMKANEDEIAALKIKMKKAGKKVDQMYEKSIDELDKKIRS